MPFLPPNQQCQSTERVVSVKHSASNHEYRTHTCMNAAEKLHFKGKAPYAHSTTAYRQRGNQSLVLFKMTTQLVKRCILSGQTVQAAGPVNSEQDDDWTLNVACFNGKILVLDLQQNSGKTTENVLKLILLLIKSGFVERKCVILLLCCVTW